MRVKIIAIVLTLIIIFTACYSIAEISCNAYDISMCSNIIAESNSDGAYLYGYKDKTLYVSTCYPKQNNYSVNTEYNIKSVVMSGKNAYALYLIDVHTNKYGILQLNTETGNTAVYIFSGLKQLFKNQFSISENYYFFARTDDVKSYVAVYDVNGEFINKHKFEDDVYSIFSNNGKSYAVLFNGAIYRLSSHETTYVCSVGSSNDVFNVGNDCICNSNGSIISLCGNNTIFVSCSKNKVVCNKTVVYTYSDGKLKCQKSNGEIEFADVTEISYLLFYNDRLICVSKDFEFEYVFASDFKSKEQSIISEEHSNMVNGNYSSDLDLKDCKIVNDKYLCITQSGLSVSSLVNNLGENTKIYDGNGEMITSGKLRSGYIANINDKSYTISIMGDITGEGNVKSNDISLMMKYLAGSESFDELQKRSADYNFDGIIDNIDLVLISKNINN